MPFRLLPIMLILSGLTLRAQVITLYDKADSTAVPYAHVLSAKFNTVSNLDGAFRVPTAYADDTLTISSIGYDPVKIVARQSGIVYLTPGVTELSPVIISDKSVADRLFEAVASMQESGLTQNTTRPIYWRGVFEGGKLVSGKIAWGFRQGLTMSTDSLIVAKNCATFDLESFSSEQTLYAQNQVYPALACLRRENESLWQYSIEETRVVNGELELLIRADFYSPEKYVEHQFLVWLNSDRNEIRKISYTYAWHLNHSVDVNDARGYSSALRRLTGTVLFREGHPFYLDATYTLEICSRFRREECLEQVIYHELSDTGGKPLLNPVNAEYYEIVRQGIDCQVE